MATRNRGRSIIYKQRENLVRKYMLNGWTALDIFKFATMEYDNKKQPVFENVNQIESHMKEIRKEWAREPEPDARDTTISLNRTLGIFDMQLYRLSKMLSEETGRGSRSETKRVNIEKRISEVALARHTLIRDTAAARSKKQPPAQEAKKPTIKEAKSTKSDTVENA